MTTFNTLRDALEEDLFLGGGPVGVPEADPVVVDYGDTTMARASGLRARPPVASDWREKEAERIARERLDAERLTPSPEMRSRVAERSRDSGLKLNSGIASLIPVASTPVKADVPAAVAGTIAPTTSTSSAPLAGTSSTVKPPPVDAGSGGDDEMASLRRRLGLLQAFEGVGSAASGKNLRTDGGILADRMKQVEALRAKKLERQEGLEVERSQNNQTLDMYKSLFPDKADSLEALRDLTGKGAVFKQGLDAWMKREELEKVKLPVAEARAGDIGAAEDLKKKKGTTEDLLREPKARKLGTAADLDEARRKALENQARADVVTSDKEARKTKADARAAEAAVTRAMERANKGGDVTTTANNFIALETVAPGFAKGQKPDWLGRFTLQKAMEVPAISNKAAALNSALENFTANIRKTLFGASLTGNEKASFDLIVNRRLTATPEQLAAAVNVLREGAARFAQNHFVTALKFHEKETSDVLRSSAVYGPALKQGGIYADVWKLPEAPESTGGVGTRQQKPTASEGYTALWNKSQGKWQEIPNEKAEAAKASGRFEE